MQTTWFQQVFSLTGRTALVTGGAGGLGSAISDALGRAGATVVVNGRDPGRCAEAVAELTRAGVAAVAEPFDVSDEPAVVRAMARLRERGLAIDILVANAGAQNRKPLVDMPLAEWQALMDVHVNGAFNCARACLPGMLERRFGRIVLMSSVAGLAALPNVGAYATAKAALASFARALAVEYGNRGITANALAPGFVRTAFTRALQESPDFGKFLATEVPAGRWAEPAEIAPAVVFLAAAAGTFVNGHVLTLDGGMLARM
ncbi:MAG: SDR family oxidoreductase [Burkholderiaceae bacterium]|nr:SDR family oxidoreductase [Burkholderiaceae bacterium]